MTEADGDVSFRADAALARRIEANGARGAAEYVRAQARVRPEIGSAVLPVAGGIAAFAGATSPLSRVTGLGMGSPVSSADLDRLEDFYHSRGCTIRIDLCPFADESLRELIDQRAYQVGESKSVFVCPVTPEVGRLAASSPGTISVAPTHDEVWAWTVARGFAERDEWVQNDLGIALPTLYRADATCFIAFLDGQAAGGGALALGDGIGHLYSGSTISRFRRHGVQTALLRARLAATAAAGCDLATVMAVLGSPSQRNVERAGFRLAYTVVTMVAPK